MASRCQKMKLMSARKGFVGSSNSGKPSSSARATAGATSSENRSAASSQLTVGAAPLHTYTDAAPIDAANSTVSTVPCWSASHHPSARSASSGR